MSKTAWRTRICLQVIIILACAGTAPARAQTPATIGGLNTDIGAADRDSFETCFTGPGAGPPGPRCEPGDFDADSDVDCDDWIGFVAS